MNNISKLFNILSSKSSEILHISKVIPILDEEVENFTDHEIEFVRAILSFRLRDNEIEPVYESVDPNGNMTTYPSIAILNEQNLELIKQLFISNSNNKILSTHLGMLLNLSGVSNRNDQIIIRDNLVDIINSIKTKFEQGKLPKNKLVELLYGPLNNLLYISKIIRDDSKILKTFNDIFVSPISIAIAPYITNLIILNFRRFREFDLELVKSKINNIINSTEDRHSKVDLYNLIIRLKQKEQKNTTSIIEKVAIEYENIALERTDSGSMLFVEKALALYEKLNDEISIKRLSDRYDEIRKKKYLFDVSDKVDVTALVKSFDEFANELEGRDFKQILQTLIKDNPVFPAKSFIGEEVAKDSDLNLIRYYAVNTVYDINGHAAQHYSTEEEVNQYLLYEKYFHHLEMRVNIFAERVIERLITNKVISGNEALDYLTTNSWLGNNHERFIRDGNSISYKWIDLIRPGLIVLFETISNSYSDKDNIVLVVDSLVTKIEGILRDLVRLNGIRVSYTREDKLKRVVTREKDINMLLAQEDVKYLLGDDVHLFLSSVFVKRTGWNFRNDIAHSFYTYGHYMKKINLNFLFLSILLLSKYEIQNSDR